MKWTAEQLQAIRTTGTNLLVSAAAGSGKTAVLAERCAHLVCDAEDRCDVDQLLVVTFTNAAAMEMRGRIEQALRKRQEIADDPRLTRQLMLLPRAQIDTLHAFCTHVLKRHFHVLGLDPNFRVLDGEEVMLLKHEVGRRMLDDRYDSGDPEFQQLVDDYADGYDARILKSVLSLHDLMESVVDPDDWLDRTTGRIAQACSAKRLADSEMGREMVGLIQRWLTDLRARWIALARTISQTRGLEPYLEYASDLLAAVDHWKQTFGNGNFDALAEAVSSYEQRRLMTIRNPPPEKEAIQEQLNRLRKEMTASTMAASCRFTEQGWKDALRATAGPSTMLVSLVREFSRRFARAKRDLRALDFADLERFTLTILRQNPGVLAPSGVAELYHRQFKHVLVDEYQDINPVQDAILSLICGADNLFCVGDVKQSIYRFRLAQPNRFLERYNRFKAKAPKAAADPCGAVIDLAANFRSRGPLLEVINSVFQRLMTASAVEIEYDESHKLRPGATYPEQNDPGCFTGAPIELHLLPPPPRDESEERSADTEADLDRSEREAVLVAHRIRELIDRKMQIAEKSSDGSLVLRPLRYRDIVVLLRSMRYKSQPFAQAMRAAAVPVHTDSATGFFDSLEVRDMFALLRLLDNQQQDIPMAAFLRSPLAGLERAEDALARIHLAYPDLPFHEAAVTYARGQEDELARKLAALFETLREWRRIARQRPVAELVWHIYNQTGYLAYCTGMPDGTQRFANLIEFHERARQFGTFQRQGLGRFMQFLQSLAEHSDLGQPSIASEADDVVRIMTIHRAKGLEFPVVFVPDLGKRHNLMDTRGAMLLDRDAGMGLMAVDSVKQVKYPSLSHVLVQDKIRKQTLAEELRVLYVAMTRAREHLILVGACDDSAPQAWNDQWASHDGPLPMECVLGASTMLDWIGPVAGCLSRSKDPAIQVTWHEEAEIERWSSAAGRRPGLPPDKASLIALTPLSPPPSAHPDAEALIERLTATYPHEPFTAIPAAISVGGMTKGELPLSGLTGLQSPTAVDRDLRTPRCLQAVTTPLATEIGSATHLVLEHLDFSRPCTREDVTLQIADLVRRKLLSADHSAVVDTDSILWFLNSDLGELIRQNHRAIYRELPVYSALLPEGAASNDPADRIMLRGRIDLLIRDQDGLVIVDYKTDAVTPATVETRAEFYRPQVRAYRDAIQRITGIPVTRAALVFLGLRAIKEV